MRHLPFQCIVSERDGCRCSLSSPGSLLSFFFLWSKLHYKYQNRSEEGTLSPNLKWLEMTSRTSRCVVIDKSQLPRQDDWSSAHLDQKNVSIDQSQFWINGDSGYGDMDMRQGMLSHLSVFVTALIPPHGHKINPPLLLRTVDRGIWYPSISQSVVRPAYQIAISSSRHLAISSCRIILL